MERTPPRDGSPAPAVVELLFPLDLAWRISRIMRSRTAARRRCVRVPGAVPALWVAAGLLAGLSPPPALAHQVPYSYLDLHMWPDSLSASLTVHVDDLAWITGVYDAAPFGDPAFVAEQQHQIEQMIGPRLAVLADSVRLEPVWESAHVVPDRKLVKFAWRASWASIPRELAVHGPLVPEDKTHETFVNFYLGDDLVDQGVASRDHPDAVYRHDQEPKIAEVIWTFIGEGIHHIFIGPDHILFIIGLLLLGGRPVRLLKIVTAFTIAHSITLALATLQIVNIPSRIVEPAIALSIVYVGVENFISVRRKRDIRAAIAFFFGFVHGFGFASVLREFGLPGHALAASLFAFNAGVEIGQATIVLAVAPLLALARAQRPRLAYPIVAVGSAFVILMGGYWFVERIIGS